jgi:signal transduction histidine kinase/ligand-binding sensor domain-containing protein/CheY-like chemotaxis protein/AraC-like DNA-binding protein
MPQRYEVAVFSCVMNLIKNILRLLCFALLMLLNMKVYSFGVPPVKYLGIEHGLSNNAVNAIFQDQEGFMWFGTYNGLNRYDGSNFVHYNSIWGDNSSLPSNHITDITQDAEHRLWIGTQKGVVIHHADEAKFVPVVYQTAAGKPAKINFNINSLQAGPKGDMYIATADAGLLVYQAKAKKAIQVFFNNNRINYHVQTLMLDRQERLWLFIKDVGLCRYDVAKQKIELINGSLKAATSLKEDNHRRLWIGTPGGLYLYNPVGQAGAQLTQVKVPLSNNNIGDLQLSANKLWIATDGGGINIMDLDTRKMDYLKAGEAEGLLKSNAVSGIYEDRDARKWIATLRGGVNIIEPKPKSFQWIKRDPLQKNSLVDNFVLSFAEDENRNLWIGTDGGGLSFYNTNTQTYVNYKADVNKPGSLSSNFIVNLVRDHKNRIWVAAFNGGIDLFQPATGTFKHYNLYHPEKKVFENNLWKLYEDSSNRLWAGTTRDGALYLYNPSTDQFDLFDKRLMNIHALLEDRMGTLWAGDYNHLIKIDTRTKKHEYFQIDRAIRSMLEDKQGNLWLGTEGGGLLLFNRQQKTFKRFTMAAGLPDNSILNILEDDLGRLWISTYHGLSNFDPSTGRFRNYGVSDGLQSNQFSYHAALKLASGELLFGGIKGFNRFDPQKVTRQHHTPELKLTGLRVNHVAVHNSLALKHLDLPYNEANLAIDYVALEYSFPEKISYAYYLEGWDLNWNQVGKATTAYYSSLRPGKYTLMIKSTDTEGNWLPPLKLTIRVLPPWYLSWWAMLSYVLITVTATYLIRLNWLRHRKLERSVENAHLDMERQKELNEKKLSFFTNISHEFRTPLTLIINPIKDLLKREDQADRSELNVIYRNAKRLLGLVDQLLLFRKAESENDQLHVVAHNFVLLCKDVFICFSQQAKLKNINYTFSSTADDITIYTDRDKIEIALFNLLSNAFNFTPEGGKIEVKLWEEDHAVCLQVADNGQGIAEDMDGKIFDKFYQGKNDSALNKGFGIGLYLVKTFIEQHSGQVSYKATAGGGITFSIHIPKGKQHFTAQQLGIVQAETDKYLSTVQSDEAMDEAAPEENVNLERLINSKQTLMIIDDNVEIRAYIKQIFKPQYHVIQAGNGEDGILLVKKSQPDIIICDVTMPGMDGIEFCRLIKQDTSVSHIPVVLLTGDYTPELKLKGIEVGAVDFISKPFDKELLMARVNGILKIKEELQHYFFKEVTLNPDNRAVSAAHRDFLNHCISIIEASLLDPDFDVKKISVEMGMSYSSLLKKIKAITGHSVNRFIRFVRLRKAAELLIHSNCNVNEAAYQVGINDVKYFRMQFFELFGMNPSDFIKKHRRAFQKSYYLNRD